jgi:MFS transporter, DHA1 family, staphyloferrin A biosynthesis exporter
LTPFASTAFRWLWSSTVASAIAGGLERTATGWLSLEAGGGAFAVGLVLSARMVPSLLFGLAAGTIADRVNRSRQLAAVGLTAVPLMGVLAWLAATSTVQVWQVVIVSFAAGCLQVFDITARQTLVVDSLPREMAVNGVALMSFVSRLAIAVGAFGAGVLISSVGVASCYVLVASFYAVAAVLVLRVQPIVADRRLAGHPPFWRAMRDAARLVVDVPAVRTLVVAGVACEIFAFSHPTAVPVVARDVLDAGAEGLGILNASISVGGTLGALLLSLVPGRVRREPLLGLVFVVYGAALLGFAAAPSLPLAALALVATGACAGSFDALQQTLMQLAVPDEQRGRAMGVWVLGIGSAPVGHLETGAMVATLGAPMALLLNGSLVLVAAAALLVRAPIYRGSLGFSVPGPSGTYPPPSR